MSEKHQIVKMEKSEKRSSGDSKVQRFFVRQKKEILTANFWRAILSEILGTLFLCAWTIGMGCHREGENVEVLDLALGAGFVIALTLSVLINASGSHINPAVSIGFLVTGQISVVRFVCYIIAQVFAGILAVYLIEGIFPEDMWGGLGLLSPGDGVTDIQAFACEFCITFALLFGIFALIDPGRTDVKGSPLFIMGLIICVNVLWAARISGACMNPARNFGPALVTGKLDKQWIYWLGPLLGGAAGTLVYDKILSARALSTTCTGGCCGSRKKTESDEIESEVMLERNAGANRHDLEESS